MKYSIKDYENADFYYGEEMSKCELFNKYEEAIKVLKNEIKFQEFREASDSLIMALKLAIEALEKQAPKNAMGKGSTKEVGYCPNCKSHLMYEPKTNYCRWCGQRLSWEVEDEQ